MLQLVCIGTVPYSFFMAKKRNTSAASPNGNIVFLPRIYDETLMLLAQAHSYFERTALLQQRMLNDRLRAMFIAEMSRITLRLSSSMAWLLARRAVLEGGLSEEVARHAHPLDGRDVCLHQHIEAESLLPAPMNELLDKSYELYARIARLDDATPKDDVPPSDPLTFS